MVSDNYFDDCYEGQEPYVFISYCREDRELRKKLVHLLREKGIRVWYDKEIHVGDMWPTVIATHLQKCRVCILLITERFVGSLNCNRELAFSSQNGIATIPVLAEGTNVSPGVGLMLAGTQYIKFRPDEALPADEILASPGIIECKGPALSGTQNSTGGGTCPPPPPPGKPTILFVNCTNRRAYAAQSERLFIALGTSNGLEATTKISADSPAEISVGEGGMRIKRSLDVPLYFRDNAQESRGAEADNFAAVQIGDETVAAIWGKAAEAALCRGSVGLLISKETAEAVCIPEDGLQLGRNYCWPDGTLDDNFICGDNSRISIKDGRYIIADIGGDGKGSLNGTLLNRSFLCAGKEYPLKDNDEIQIGETVLNFFLAPVQCLEA